MEIKLKLKFLINYQKETLKEKLLKYQKEKQLNLLEQLKTVKVSLFLYLKIKRFLQIFSSEKKGKKNPFNPSAPPAEFDDPNKVRSTVKIGKKTQIDQSQIGVPPGGKEAPVTKYKIGDTPPESKVEKARKAKLKKDLQTDMMSKAEGPKKQGRKITGSTYRKDLDSTIKVKKKLKSQPLVKGLEKAIRFQSSFLNKKNLDVMVIGNDFHKNVRKLIDQLLHEKVLDNSQIDIRKLFSKIKNEAIYKKFNFLAY